MCTIIQSVVFLVLILYGEEVLGRHYCPDDIVGGYNITIQDAPYQVFLLISPGKGERPVFCGGSIISPKYVLTAAHCLVGAKEVVVRIGSTDSQSGGTQYTSKSFKAHPLYKKGLNFDVGLIKMDQDMKLDGKNAKAIKLAEANTSVKPGIELLVTGWGATLEKGPPTRYLMAVKLPTISTADCNKHYPHSITNNMICAAVPEGGKDSCQGDSGGPAVNNHIQLGIVSSGDGCARKGAPGIYTKVSAVRAWIRTNAGV